MYKDPEKRREYARRNRDRLNARRRERYKEDPEFRQRQKDYIRKHIDGNPDHKDNLKRSKERHQETPRGLLSKIYSGQQANGKRRGHGYPSYSRQDLYDRYLMDPIYNDLFCKWLAGGKQKDEIPSFDRIDDTKGYSFDNIVLTTWRANREKQMDIIRSKGKDWAWGPKRVFVYLNGLYHSEYDTYAEAQRSLGFRIYSLSVDSGRPNKSGYSFYSHPITQKDVS